MWYWALFLCNGQIPCLGQHVIRMVVECCPPWSFPVSYRSSPSNQTWVSPSKFPTADVSVEFQCAQHQSLTYLQERVKKLPGHWHPSSLELSSQENPLTLTVVFLKCQEYLKYLRIVEFPKAALLKFEASTGHWTCCYFLWGCGGEGLWKDQRQDWFVLWWGIMLETVDLWHGQAPSFTQIMISRV